MTCHCSNRDAYLCQKHQDLSRAFDDGDYAAAYETEDYAAARQEREGFDADYHAAFILGFFSSYEPHEMGEHEDDWRQALESEVGRYVSNEGWIDPPEAEEENDA